MDLDAFLSSLKIAAQEFKRAIGININLTVYSNSIN